MGAIFLVVNAAVSGALGALLGFAGAQLPDLSVTTALAAVSLAYATFFVVRGRVPFVPWPPQLPATWIDVKRPRATAIRYAVVWGLAFSTPIRAGSLVALALFVTVRGDPVAGALLFSLVGCLRALPTAVVPLRRVPDGPGIASRRAHLARPVVTTLDAVNLTVVLAVLVQPAIGL